MSLPRFLTLIVLAFIIAATLVFVAAFIGALIPCPSWDLTC